MDPKFENPYDPKNTEDRIYKLWEESGFFNPDNLPNARKEPFTIIMPPPNANGHLHAGHAMFVTLEDIMTRYKRMCGYKALWLPGADHAGFETQIVYERQLEKEGRSRFDMSRKELYKEIMDFTLNNKINMENDLRMLGASCDWSRERFTLDSDIVEKVQKTFVKMCKEELVYRGKRPVNWCTKHQTSLSDVETDNEERTDKLYYIKYGPLTVATVRPETIFGDVAVAVNPNDDRYKDYIGKDIEAKIPTGTLKLAVIADEDVEMEFGTGALKITPAHDMNDFEIGKRNNLKPVVVIDAFGKLNEKTGKYNGMKINKAREAVVKDLEEMGLIEKIEDYTHSVPVCYKCGTSIEPRIMDQWFVKMESLAKKAAEAVDARRIKFIPEHHKKIFLYWMNNTIDWNISRQIVWGIPIPAVVCKSCGFGIPSTEYREKKCEKCGGKMEKDTDTFDTWFSSGQWPLLTLNFPDGEDFKTYYPTDVMETGYDLIFKWIPRMVIFGLYLASEVPFKTVYLNGLINDAQGKKMSKSRGNVISPIDIVEKYGADALRMALVVGNAPGVDVALSENKIKGYKHFSNKIWNVSRFVLTNTEEVKMSSKPELTERDSQHLEELTELCKDVTKDLDNYKYHIATEKLYHYAWHTFADKIIEETKERINSGSSEDKLSAQWTLYEILKNILIMLHPFMPFITEEIWQSMPNTNKMLIVEPWPK